jgi:hypothetical protein
MTAYYIQNFNMPPLIWGEKCDTSVMVVTYDSTNEHDYLEIKDVLRPDDVSRLGTTHKITFSGELTKDPIEGHTPIKGLLQHYTFVLRKIHKSSRTKNQ